MERLRDRDGDGDKGDKQESVFLRVFHDAVRLLHIQSDEQLEERSDNRPNKRRPLALAAGVGAVALVAAGCIPNTPPSTTTTTLGNWYHPTTTTTSPENTTTTTKPTTTTTTTSSTTTTEPSTTTTTSTSTTTTTTMPTQNYSLLVPLGTLQANGFNTFDGSTPGTESVVNGVNSDGVMVGWGDSYSPSGLYDAVSHAWIWNPTQGINSATGAPISAEVDLTPELTGNANSYSDAEGVNAGGEVAGNADPNPGDSYPNDLGTDNVPVPSDFAYLYKGGKLTAAEKNIYFQVAEPSGTGTSSEVLSDSGDAVGVDLTDSEPAIWSGGNTQSDVTDLPVPTGDTGEGYAIVGNVVVGEVTNPVTQEQDAVVWTDLATPGDEIDLGTLPGGDVAVADGVSTTSGSGDIYVTGISNTAEGEQDGFDVTITGGTPSSLVDLGPNSQGLAVNSSNAPAGFVQPSGSSTEATVWGVDSSSNVTVETPPELIQALSDNGYTSTSIVGETSSGVLAINATNSENDPEALIFEPEYPLTGQPVGQ